MSKKQETPVVADNADLCAILRFIDTHRDKSSIKARQEEILEEFLREHVAYIVVPGDQVASGQRQEKLASAPEIREALMLAVRKHKTAGRGIKGGDKGKNINDLFRSGVAETLEASYLREIGWQARSQRGAKGKKRSTVVEDSDEEELAQPAPRKRRRLTPASVEPTFTAEAQSTQPVSGSLKRPLELDDSERELSDTPFDEDTMRLAAGKRRKLAGSAPPLPITRLNSVAETQITSLAPKGSKRPLESDEAEEAVGGTRHPARQVPLPDTKRRRIAPVSVSGIAAGTQISALKQAALVSESDTEQASAYSASGGPAVNRSAEEVIGQDKNAFAVPPPAGSAQEQPITTQTAAEGSRVDVHAMPREDFRQNRRELWDYQRSLDDEGNWVEVCMGRVGSEIINASIHHMEQHGIDALAAATFCLKPPPALDQLYSEIFGTSAWRSHLAGLQEADVDFKYAAKDVLKGLCGAAIFKDVLTAGSTEFDIARRVREALSERDIKFLAASTESFGYSLDMVLRLASRRQIQDWEFRETTLAEYATEFAGGLALTLQPHLKMMTKSAVPEPRDPNAESWLRPLALAFKEAIALRLKMELPEDIKFQAVSYKAGEPMEYGKHRAFLSTILDDDVVGFTMLPGIEQETVHGTDIAARAIVVVQRHAGAKRVGPE